MDKIFYGCKLLKSIPDISNWKTKKIKSMNQLFFQCLSLEELPDISKWDTSNLIDTELQFETAASEFRLIDDNTVSVIVNWKNSMELVSTLRQDGPSYSLMKKLSQFSVNVRNNEMKKLVDAGAVEEVLEGVYVVSDPKFYDKEIGLVTDNHWIEESLIV